MKSPALMASVPTKELILYTRAIDHSIGALLAQKNEQGDEAELYYLSRMMDRRQTKL